VAVGLGEVLLDPLPGPPHAVTVTVQVVVTGAQLEVVKAAELVVTLRASRSLAMAAPIRAEVMAKKRIVTDLYYLKTKGFEMVDNVLKTGSTRTSSD